MSSSTIKKKYTSKISEIKKHNQYYFEKNNPKISCIIGLVAEASRLHDVRKNRLSTIKEKEHTKYTKLETIQNEIDNSRKTFKKYQWPVIDVTRKSVEETAASVIKIHEIYANKK